MWQEITRVIRKTLYNIKINNINNSQANGKEFLEESLAASNLHECK